MGLPTHLVPLNRFPTVILKSKQLRTLLAEYRDLLSIPKASATECEQFAKTFETYVVPEVREPTRKTAKKQKHRQIEDSIKARVSQGRQEVLAGNRPKLIDAVVQVLGKDTLSGPQILARLEQRGWAPAAVNNPAYISYTLSDNTGVFERVRRGVYRNRIKGADVDLKAEVSRLLADRKVFPTNASLIQAAPLSVRKNLTAKDSRKRVMRMLVDTQSSDLPSFLATLKAAARTP